MSTCCIPAIVSNSGPAAQSVLSSSFLTETAHAVHGFASNFFQTAIVPGTIAVGTAIGSAIVLHPEITAAIVTAGICVLIISIFAYMTGKGEEEKFDGIDPSLQPTHKKTRKKV